MQATKGNLTLEIHQDLEPENPRRSTDGNCSTMVCWHKRYVLGDEQPGDGLVDDLHRPLHLGGRQVRRWSVLTGGCDRGGGLLKDPVQVEP
jgi:hypothetical protein